MLNAAIIPAVLTGLFCVVFALVVRSVSSFLMIEAFLFMSFISGFCGSLFAFFVWRRNSDA